MRKALLSIEYKAHSLQKEKKPSVKHSSKLHTNRSSKSKSTKVPELAERQAIYKACCGNRQKVTDKSADNEGNQHKSTKSNHSTGKAACCATMRERVQNRNEDKLSNKNARKLPDACKPYRKALFKLSQAYCNHTHKIYDKNGASGNGKSAESAAIVKIVNHYIPDFKDQNENVPEAEKKIEKLVNDGYEIKGFTFVPDKLTYVWTLVKTMKKVGAT
uniref:SCP domain-containing protein n=1 Tax=Globodera pallida TaxID=36090 RepID=A0A183BTZ5_GLOPA